jgi:deazaflavin-dependent oxidoreductase (nitroreductase family)
VGPLVSTLDVLEGVDIESFDVYHHAMTTPATAVARRERQARLMKIVNVPMRFVLGLPFATPLSSRLMLLTHTGRRTGRVYRQPVSYVADGDTLLTPGGGNWKRNLRNGEPVNLRLRGRDVVARPELVRDADEAERLLRLMVARSPRLASFVPFVWRNGTFDLSELKTALDHGFAIFRWRLDSQDTGRGGQA